jgi:glycosyltransferase involved in cell wall biosynthesis
MATFGGSEMEEHLPSVILVSTAFQVRGSSSYTLRLAESLSEFGFAPTIITPDSEQIPEITRRTLDIIDCNLADMPLLRPVSTLLAARDISPLKPVLMHIQSRDALPFGLAVAKRLKVPVIATMHDYFASRDRLTLPPTEVSRVIAVSDSVKAGILEWTSIPESMIEVIHSGVRVPDADHVHEVFSVDQIPVIGTAGPLERSKGLPYFLQAARTVLDAGHDVEFLIAGSGPEEHQLRRLTRDLKLTSRVTFISSLLEFTEPLKAMDVFCLPSLEQGLGTVMLEAMALSRPVIATQVGGVSTIVRDGETGLIIPPSDSDRMAERMIELLTDPLRARRIGQTARQLVIDHFHSTQMVQQTASVYLSVLAEFAATRLAQAGN